MSQFRLRMKLLLADRKAMIALIISTVIVLAVILSIKTYADERSALPIGLNVLDTGIEAGELADSIRKCEALYVYSGTGEELEGLLADGYINCYFTIPVDYGTRLEAGETEGLVSICAAKDDKIAVVCSDLVAGYMIDRICTVRTYDRYENLDKTGIDNPLSESEYRAYVDELSKDDLFTFNFDVKFIDAGSKKVTYRDISNSMMYMQVIAGFIALLITLTAFSACEEVASEGEKGLMRRLDTVPGSRIYGAFSQILAIIIYLMPLPAVVAVLFGIQNGFVPALKIMLISILLDAVFVVIFYLIAILTKGTSAYQIGGSAIIIGFGIMGFVSIFMGLLGTRIFSATPLAWYIARFVECI